VPQFLDQLTDDLLPTLPSGCRQTPRKPSEYTKVMYYSVGSRIRVKLYSGEEVEAEVTAIMDQSSGRKVQIRFGGVTILISPEQIIEVLRQ
jgi:hypothetical protein